MIAARTFIAFPRYGPRTDVLLGWACLQRRPQIHVGGSFIHPVSASACPMRLLAIEVGHALDAVVHRPQH
jgi:hypothetical protein